MVVKGAVPLQKVGN